MREKYRGVALLKPPCSNRVKVWPFGPFEIFGRLEWKVGWTGWSVKAIFGPFEIMGRLERMVGWSRFVTF